MANKLIIAGALIALLFLYSMVSHPLLAKASGTLSGDITSQLGTTTQKQRSLKFVSIMPCDERKSQDLCAVSGLEPGTSLTILMKKDKTCTATALERTFIESEIGSSMGTKLQTDCALRDSFDSIAIVDEPVVDFKIMDYPFIKDLKDATSIASIDKEIKQRHFLDNFINKNRTKNIENILPKLHIFSYPMAVVYFADYSTGLFPNAPLMMINKDIYYLVSDVNECWDIQSQFRLNSRYFINVHKCTCDTDGCWSEYVEVTKKGFIRHQ